jgi:hypothetical protein
MHRPPGHGPRRSSLVLGVRVSSRVVGRGMRQRADVVGLVPDHDLRPRKILN